MPLAPTPVEIARRRASRQVLCALMLLAAALWLGRGVVRAFTPPPIRGEPPRPLTVDIAADPPERLVFLPGIGPARADAIAEDRRRHGPVASLDDLVRVRGIGPGTVERIRQATEVRVIVGAPR